MRRADYHGCEDWNAIATYRNAVLIYNPVAGRIRRRGGKLVGAVLDALKGAGHQVTAIPTTGPRTAGKLAREAIERGAELILSLGGDGTLNETLNGVAGSHVPIAMLPAGTANVLARELRAGCNAVSVARAVHEWVPRRVALGRLRCEPDQQRYFALMAGVGFDAHIVYHLHLPLKARIGQLAYWLGAMKELARSRLEQFDVRMNGRAFAVPFAVASRVCNYAGYLSLARNASLLRDDFEVVLFEGRSALQLYARYLLPVAMSRTMNTKGIQFINAREARFECPRDERIYVQVDGEYAGRLPAEIEIVPDALTFLVPPAFRPA